jgi:hypothetical protein
MVADPETAAAAERRRKAAQRQRDRRHRLRHATGQWRISVDVVAIDRLIELHLLDPAAAGDRAAEQEALARFIARALKINVTA